MEQKEKTIKSQEIFKGKILNLFVDEVKLPNGHTSTRELIRHCKASCVLAINEKNEIIIEEQFRYPYDTTLIEFPAGKCDKDEDPKDTALRELAEETGYIANNIELLGLFYPTCAYSDEVIYLYIATDLKEGKQHLDKDETLSFSWIKLNEFIKMIQEDKVRDGKTLATMTYYLTKYRTIS